MQQCQNGNCNDQIQNGNYCILVMMGSSRSTICLLIYLEVSLHGVGGSTQTNDLSFRIWPRNWVRILVSLMMMILLPPRTRLTLPLSHLVPPPPFLFYPSASLYLISVPYLLQWAREPPMTRQWPVKRVGRHSPSLWHSWHSPKLCAAIAPFVSCTDCFTAANTIAGGELWLHGSLY